MRQRPTLCSALIIVAVALAPRQSGAESVVAALSDHLITITSSYAGTKLLLFGAVGEERGDVVVVVRGPNLPMVVRQKERTLGLWLNRDSLVFPQVPGYYAVAATRPLDQIATPAVLARNGIGAENLRLEAATGGTGNAEAGSVEPYRQAIVRNLRRQNLYAGEPGAVTRLGGRLFRSEIAFPANVPVGDYTAIVYVFEQGELMNAQTMPLFVRKVGIERSIFEYANTTPLGYGVIAVVLAMLAGWIASAVFRRT